MPVTPQFIDSMRDAYLLFSREVALEGERPVVIALPDPEWDVAEIGGAPLFFKRPESKAAWKRLREKFFRLEWITKWSHSHITDTMSTATAASVAAQNDPVRVRAAMATAATALDEAPPEHKVITAVGGVHAQQEIYFGERVRLFQMTDAEYERLLNVFRAILETTPHTAEERVELERRLEQDVSKLRTWTCVEVTVNGDIAKAQHDLDDAAEPVIDLLQMIAAIREAAPITVIAGIVPTPRPPVIVVKADGSHANWHFTLRHTRRVNLNAVIVEELRRDGFSALLDAVNKSPMERSEFEEILVTSMHWISDAHRQTNPENSITSYTTAMEMFFSASGSPVVKDVSEGVACLLGKTLDDRKAIRKRIVDLYDRRSKVSHRGEREADERDVQRLKDASINVLARMSKLAWRFKKRDDVRDWFADLRLSVAYEDDPTEEQPDARAEPTYRSTS